MNVDHFLGLPGFSISQRSPGFPWSPRFTIQQVDPVTLPKVHAPRAHVHSTHLQEHASQIFAKRRGFTRRFKNFKISP